ncbi:MAG TPA: alcohol dehydrogenase catalytic domain-containing protein, partial [Beutenbergiaceae bacterium]|nr:alcohol dehydrogenase catalytic domain-containing protein [Beutenbergiaceae bacterium]
MRVHAAYTQRLGPTELITYGQVDVADAASDDVVISTKAVALNPVDTYIRSGRFDTRVSFPLILGRDVVGVVEQAPADSGLRPGQRVWANTMGFDGRQGSFATAVVAHRNRVYPLPQQVDPL